jgi:hypothetical protein
MASLSWRGLEFDVHGRPMIRCVDHETTENFRSFKMEKNNFRDRGCQDVASVLKDLRADVLINLLPAGSIYAQDFTDLHQQRVSPRRPMI